MYILTTPTKLKMRICLVYLYVKITLIIPTSRILLRFEINEYLSFVQRCRPSFPIVSSSVIILSNAREIPKLGVWISLFIPVQMTLMISSPNNWPTSKNPPIPPWAWLPGHCVAVQSCLMTRLTIHHQTHLHPRWENNSHGKGRGRPPYTWVVYL